jgi:tetratricopeptide (TPR) repeat protein
MADLSPETAAQLQSLEKSYAGNPGRFFVPYAGLLREAGSPAQAEEILRENLKRFPGLSAHVLLGRCLADRGAHEEAANEFQYVLSIDAQNLIALRTLAEMAATTGRRDEAQRWYRDLLSVDPMNGDARAALARLDQAAPDAGSADHPLGGPDGWPGAGEASGSVTADAAGPVEADWGDLELQGSGDDGEPAPGPSVEFDAFGFGGVELTGRGIGEGTSGGEPDGNGPADDRGAERTSTDEDGHFALLDFSPEADAEAGTDPRSGAEELDLEPAELDPGEAMVTETMAELYASQGLLERAAEVYRELIRRRGEEPALCDRLDTLERLLDPGDDDGDGDAGEAGVAGITPDWLERIETGSFDAPDGEVPDPVPSGEAAVGEEAVETGGGGHGTPGFREADVWSGDDPFATSVSFGFTGEPEPDAAEEEEADAPAEAGYDLVVVEDGGALDGDHHPPSTAEEAADLSAGWALAAAPLDPMDAGGPAGAEPPRTMRDYLASLLEWKRAGTDDDALPWELPRDPGASPALGAGDEATAAGAEFSLESFFTPGDAAADEPSPEAAPGAPSFEPEPPRVATPAPREEPAAGAGDERGEDEDLESFQAWLQSLKR